jgi:hypothetical protein
VFTRRPLCDQYTTAVVVQRGGDHEGGGADGGTGARH